MNADTINWDGDSGEMSRLGVWNIKHRALLMCLRCLLDSVEVMLGGQLKITVWSSGQDLGQK